IFQRSLYGGTWALLHKGFSRWGIEATVAQGVDLASLSACLRPNTRLVYLETPSNPLLGITNIQEITAWAKQHNLLTVIDNTFATPILQKPLTLGCDVVMHSATKYLSGHSDLCAGAVVGDAASVAKIYEMCKILGGSLNAVDVALLERSMKTLSVRVLQQSQNALTLAQRLQQHPKVRDVFYPGLETHPGHEIAKQQMQGGFGGMLSFAIDPDRDALRVQQELQWIAPVMSLGGVETTICSPYLTSHAGLSAEERAEEGIHEHVLRLSVGIEDVDDLWKDLERALSSEDALKSPTEPADMGDQWKAFEQDLSK
ncbi:MAG: PLP-dependent aspartate aminotransferase family protein, partial [Myxococcota bacterium]